MIRDGDYAAVKRMKKEVPEYEDAVSAWQKTQVKSTWFSRENEYSRRKKSFSRKKSKGKKSFVGLSLPGLLTEGFLHLLSALHGGRTAADKNPSLYV